jgi:hypothetical protein
MTVTRKTEQGYLVCRWQEHGLTRESMFFRELLVEETSAPPQKSKDA